MLFRAIRAISRIYFPIKNRNTPKNHCAHAKMKLLKLEKL